VFRRRKPDESRAAGSTVFATLAASGLLKGGSGGRGDPVVLNPAQPGPVDTGLGVPPFRPAPLKKAPTMSRTPFATVSASPNPPQNTLQPSSAPSGQWPATQPSRPPARDPAERRTLVVGRGISVQGTVQDAERLVVEGTVEATMIHATELAISQGGVFKGEVQVEEAEIAGTIDGTLTVRNSLMVRSSGRVLGTARCKRLQVEDGGQITGRIEMLADGAPSPKADAARLTPEPAI
jgi:cytoskeletal protein CcmA (bactofilin family)